MVIHEALLLNNSYLLMSQVMIEAASSEEQKTPEYRTRKLESLTRQNELIEEENRKREEAEQAQVRGCASIASCGHDSRSHQNLSCVTVRMHHD